MSSMKAASARSSRAKRAREHDEAGARELGRPLEVHQPEGLADLEVLLRATVGVGRLAPAPDLDIGALVGAVGHIVRRQVGKALRVSSSSSAPSAFSSCSSACALAFSVRNLGDEG